jgi:thymidylate synthase (FAD)
MGKEETGRLTVPAAEEILGREFKVLDKGFVRLVDYMGGDDAIVQAARVSYGKGTKKVSEDRGLIRYLMRNRHTTPFEMVELKFHAKMPIFVARQWIRHRTANVNEYSGRYSVMEDEFYVPEVENVAAQSKSNKQGRDEILGSEITQKFVDTLSRDQSNLYARYQETLDDGVAKELSRIGLPLNLYTQWYWKIDLHNLFHFLGLRMDEHAQYEIREYADVMAEMARAVAPNAYESFEDYALNSIRLSGLEVDALKRIMAGEDIEEVKTSIKNRRERGEFEAKLPKILGSEAEIKT